jgi:GT2 family glycosyltransferase
MPSVICLAVFDTEENGRTVYTEKTLTSIFDRIDLSKHRIIVSDNGSCESTHKLYSIFNDPSLKIILNGSNIGTANAINKAWQLRNPEEFCIKMDNDVVVNYDNWVDEMEEVFKKNKSIGVVGLKRRDLSEWPVGENKSKLIPLIHERGEKWVIVEEVNHMMGTCNMYSPEIIEKIGYLYQHTLYGFDDSFSSLRVRIAGYKNVFLPHIDIDHIDVGGDVFCDWKIKHATENWKEFEQISEEYRTGKRDIYYNGIGYETITENGVNYFISKRI